MDRCAARAVLVALVTLVGSGCGGGDGSGDTLGVTFSPSGITLTTWEDWTGVQAVVTATVSPAPSGTTYVGVVDSGSTFLPGELSISVIDASSFRATVPLQSGLSLGAHSGTLTVMICHDAACGQPYPLTQSTVPYDVTVLDVAPGAAVPTATVKIDGVVVTPDTEVLSGSVRTYTVGMTSGHTVELEPTLPFLTRSVSDMDSWVNVLILQPAANGSLRSTLTLGSPPVAGHAVLQGRSEGGGTVKLRVNVQP